MTRSSNIKRKTKETDITLSLLLDGEGKGKNWWGILYPNLCLTEGSYEVIEEEQDEKLKAILSEEEYRTILSAKTEDTQVSFRCLEIIQEWLSR